jgi:hypothetical protein
MQPIPVSIITMLLIRNRNNECKISKDRVIYFTLTGTLLKSVILAAMSSLTHNPEHSTGVYHGTSESAWTLGAVSC